MSGGRGYVHWSERDAEISASGDKYLYPGEEGREGIVLIRESGTARGSVRRGDRASAPGQAPPPPPPP